MDKNKRDYINKLKSSPYTIPVLLVLFAYLLILVGYLVGAKYKDDSFVEKLSEQMHVHPLKTEGVLTIDSEHISKAITDSLAPVLIEFQKAQPPMFDNEAIAIAIANNINSIPRENTSSQGMFSDVSGSLMLGVIAMLSSLLFLVFIKLTNKGPWYKYAAIVIPIITAVFGGVISLLEVLAPYIFSEARSESQFVLNIDSTNSGEKAITQTFFDASAGYAISFASGDDMAPREAVCAAKKSLNERGANFAIVIGGHDQQPLSHSAKLRFNSNAGLAKQRAESVRRILADFSDSMCGTAPIETILLLTDVPFSIGTESNTDKRRENDRIARVYGFGRRLVDDTRVETIRK